jgi:ABC-type branched-subunit amino acid transport system ATPase component
MVNWQITATTLLCAANGAEVTVMVYKDGTLKCTGDTVAQSDKTRRSACSASSCPQVKTYRDKLTVEEKHASE